MLHKSKIVTEQYLSTRKVRMQCKQKSGLSHGLDSLKLFSFNCLTTEAVKVTRSGESVLFDWSIDFLRNLSVKLGLLQCDLKRSNTWWKTQWSFLSFKICKKYISENNNVNWRSALKVRKHQFQEQKSVTSLFSHIHTWRRGRESNPSRLLRHQARVHQQSKRNCRRWSCKERWFDVGQARKEATALHFRFRRGFLCYPAKINQSKNLKWIKTEFNRSRDTNIYNKWLKLGISINKFIPVIKKTVDEKQL